MTYDTQIAHTASYVVFRRGDKVAFVLRSNTSWMNNHYGLPSGKVEQDESFLQAAIREAKEEVGVNLKPENLKMIHVAHRNADSVWIDVYYEAINCDQEPMNAEPHLHSELAWLDINNLPKNVIPAVVDALKYINKGQIISYFNW